MIENIRYLTPYIDFGFGITTKNARLNDTVTVWLSTLYNQEAYSFSFVGPGTVTKITNYQYTITHNVPGTYNLQLIVTLKATSTRLESNLLTLNLNPN